MDSTNTQGSVYLTEKNDMANLFRVIEALKKTDWFKGIYTAAGSFYKTIMGTDVNDLLTWIDTYRNSCIKELKTLAYGISLDIKAVQNAVLYDISNGIVEGFVNKLKVVKRMKPTKK